MNRISLFLNKIFSKHSLSFDIGSFYTKVYTHKLIYSEPTCLLYDFAEDEVLDIGDSAYKYFRKTTKTKELIFPVNFGLMTDSFMFSKYVLFLISKIKKKQKIKLFTRLNFVVSNINFPFDIYVYKKTINSLGFLNIKVLPEASVLAKSYKKNIESMDSIVIDVGAQITSFYVFVNKELVKFSSYRFGSMILTKKIIQFILEKYHVEIDWPQAEKIKLSLNKNKKIEIIGKDIKTNMISAFFIKKQEFEDIINEFFATLFSIIQLFFGKVSSDIILTALKSNVFIFGGGAKVQGLKQFLELKLETNIIILDDTNMLFKVDNYETKI